MAYVDTTGDIMRVTMAWEYPNGQFLENVFHYMCGSAGTGDSRMALCNNINSGYATHLAPVTSSVVKYYGSRCSVIKAALPFNPVFTISNSPGNSPDPPAPSQVRMLTTWLTDFSGPAYRGRTYHHTPPTTAISANGEPTAAAITQYANFGTFMLTPVVSGGSTWSIGVLHYEKRTTVSQPIGFTQIKTKITGTRWATQRRGGDYGKPNLPPW